MKVALVVFPAVWDTHLTDKTSNGQRLEPSVLGLAPDLPGTETMFLSDNRPREDIDLYLCSVYTRGWSEFKAFSARVGREKIIAGGYHPTAMPETCLPHAHKVVTGLCGNVEEIIASSRQGIHAGIFKPRPIRRDLIDMGMMNQVYPDVYPGMATGSLTTSVGCPYDCDFCSTPTMSDRRMHASPLDIVRAEIASLQFYGTEAVFVRDESFATHPMFDEVVPLLGDAGFKVLYSFGTGSAMNEKKIRFLADNGWHSLCFGLEDVGTRYRKNVRLNGGGLREACKLCHVHGLGITLSFIVNDDGKGREESEAHYQAIFDAFVDHKPTQVCANFLMPFPGTGLWPSYKDRITEADWEKYDSKTPILSAPDLHEWHRAMVLAVQLEYYYSPEYATFRDFACGDNLHLRFVELQKQYDMEDGRWRRFFRRRAS